MDGPLVSFVILSYNRRDVLGNAIASAARQRYPHKEIIVVDNGSTDGTMAYLEEEAQGIRYLSLWQNMGLPVARNEGIRAAKGDIFIFMDDDCVLENESSVDLVVSQFAADGDCGAIAFRILDPKTRREWPYGLHNGPHAPVAYESILFRGGGVAMRREMLNDVGLFWDPLFIVHEDTDLSLRMAAKGWRIMARSDIVILHPAPAVNATPNARREVYFKVRNTIWLAIKLMPVSMMAGFMLPVFARSLNLAVRTGRITFFIRAIVDGMRGMSRCLHERRPVSRAWVDRARQLHMRLWT